MPLEISIRQVDAFTTTPLAGNPAGVVTSGGESLTADQMQAVAREMNAAETAFLLPPTRPDADVRIRWFTPAVEVPLCGHATVASFHAAAEEGSWGLAADGVHGFRLETLSGVLPIEVTKRSGHPALVRMGLPDPVVEPWPDPSRAAPALGLGRDDLAGDLPAINCGFFALVPLRDLAAMRAIRAGARAVADLTEALGGDGLIAATLETLDAGSAVHVRMFAPAAGVDEDPVTGSAQGPVAGWLARIGFFGAGDRDRSAAGAAARAAPAGSAPADVVDGAPTDATAAGPAPSALHAARLRRLPGGRFGYTAEQGDLIGRRGRIDVELSVAIEGGAPRARGVSILGRAVTVLRGTIRVA